MRWSVAVIALAATSMVAGWQSPASAELNSINPRTPGAGAPPQTAPQSRATKCEAAAAARKLGGAARTTFLDQCMTGKAQAPATTPAQKTASCNAQATARNLSGLARQAFVANCLSATP
jgi:hypothetical protein